MKILVCNKFYRPVGGPETIVYDTVRELNALGHTAIPFGMAHPDNWESEYSPYFVPGIDYNTVQGKGMSRLLKEAKDIVYSSEARAKIEKLIADTTPDIAHAHNVYHQLSPSILMALRKAKIPTVLTLHDGKLVCPNMLFLRGGTTVCEKCAGWKFHHAVLNRCVKDSLASSLLCCVESTIHRMLGWYERNVDLFITPSRFLKREMVDHGRLKDQQVEVLYNYAETKGITPEYTPGSYGFFLGKIEAFKGVYTVLESCKRLPDFEVRLAGRGSALVDGQKIAEQEGLSRVKFLGFQTGADLTRLLRESRFVLVPSEWYENCPMVILEAFSAGKPVIASRIGGIPELIDHGVDGLLFEPGDADALASHMRTLAENPEMASEMGRKARQKVEERFSIEKYMQSLLGIYQKVLDRPRG